MRSSIHTAAVAAVAAVLAILLVGPTAAQCGQGGAAGIPQLDITSNLWDSDFEITLTNAAPNANNVILLDTSPGPTPTAIGTICTGNTPLIIASSYDFTSPLTNGSGAMAIPGTFGAFTTLHLTGIPFYLQALVVDFSAPFHLALTNRLDLTIETPRVFVNEYQCGVWSSIAIYDSRTLAGFPGGAPKQTILPPVQPGALFGTHIFGVSRDGTRLLVQSYQNATMNLTIDLTQYDLTTTPPTLVGSTVIPTFGGGNADPPCVFAPDGDSAYCNVLGNVVARIDTDPQSPTFLSILSQSAPLPGPPSSLAVADDGALVYVQTQDFNTPFAEGISILNSAAMATLASLQIVRATAGIGTFPTLALSADGAFLASTRPGAIAPFGTIPADIAVFDLTTFSQVGSVTPQGHTQFRGATFDPSDSTNSTLLYTELNGTGNQQLVRLMWSTGNSAAVPITPAVPQYCQVTSTPNGTYLFVSVESGTPVIHTFDAAFNLIMTTPTSGDAIGQTIVEHR